MYANERVTVTFNVIVCTSELCVSSGNAYEGMNVNNKELKILEFIQVTLGINFYDFYFADN